MLRIVSRNMCCDFARYIFLVLCVHGYPLISGFFGPTSLRGLAFVLSAMNAELVGGEQRDMVKDTVPGSFRTSCHPESCAGVPALRHMSCGQAFAEDDLKAGEDKREVKAGGPTVCSGDVLFCKC